MSKNEGRALVQTMVEIDPKYEDEFNSWYREKHYPALSSCPGVLSVKRYRSAEHPHLYLSIIELESLAAAETEQYTKARTSPFAQHFTKRSRGLFMNVTPETAGESTEPSVTSR